MRKYIFILPVLTALASTVVDLRPVDTENAVTFTVKNFGINTNGEIKGLSGSIKWDAANPAASSFSVSVDVNTINTGIEMRDRHLKKEEYFDAEQYPKINFTSTSVNAGVIAGNLTLKGVTKPISFPFSVTPAERGYLFEGSFSINRKDYGINAGSATIGNNVTVKLKVLAKP